ncbi:adenylyltransferase [Candidatus Bathyarchaeota archaeon]|nr:MAG: adenylyltransferase [Candidatus Bathyarchaeota archaeon]
MRQEALSDEEVLRYDRQIRVRGFGLEGQGKLRKATVVVVGVGGLGCPAATYLVAAGVGRMRLVDGGEIALTDLNRQFLYSREDVGKPKVEVAAERLGELNPYVEVEPIGEELDERNVGDLLEGADLVVDGLDNWRTRFLVNEACVREGIPFIHAGVRGFYGQMTTIVPGEGPCLRCILKATPPEEDVIPVLGPTPAVLGSLQALEAIKLITGLGEPLVGRLLIFDGLHMKLEEIYVSRDRRCPVCGSAKS